MAVIIELYGAPCTGKTTLAAELVVEAKKAGLRVEHCQEVAKQWLYNRDIRMKDQFSIIAAQYLENHKYDHILQELDILVVEAPIFLQLSYGEELPEIARIAREKRDISHVYMAGVLDNPFGFDAFGRNPQKNEQFNPERLQKYIRKVYGSNAYSGKYEQVRKSLFNLIHMKLSIRDFFIKWPVEGTQCGKK